MKTFGVEFLIYGVLLFLFDMALTLLQPILLKKLLNYFDSNRENVPQTQAYCYVLVLILASLAYLTSFHFTYLGLYSLGLKVRVACSSLVYKKILTLRKESLQDLTSGQIINLLSNDIHRIDLVLPTLHCLWSAPLKILLATIYLNISFGYNATFGILGILVFVIAQLLITRKLSQVKQKLAPQTDQRIRLFNDIIRGIQIIKMCTWEESFSKYITDVRKSETDKLTTANHLRFLCAVFKVYVSKISVFLCILASIVNNMPLTPQNVYALMTIYENLKTTATTRLPFALIRTTESKVTIERIQNVLLVDCHNPGPRGIIHGLNIKFLKPKMPTICIRNAWFQLNGATLLHNITFNASPGDLIGVIGSAGSGKTTLLHAILSEVSPVKGIIEVEGTISYASQEPWIFSASVRQNILFREEFNAGKYSQVVKVCALEYDLTQLPFGDNTLVGERGTMLSGGQKARINLARAVYKNADIYLLDDPLSAVDTHVARHIFDECIVRYLGGKCVVLVTHQVQYLKNTTRIYKLDKGRIDKTGSFDIGLEDKSSGDKNDTKSVILGEFQVPTAVKEERGTGSATKVYRDYFLNATGVTITLAVFLLFALNTLIGYLIDIFITFWINSKIDIDTNDKLYIYGFLVLLLVFGTHVATWFFVKYTVSISKFLHDVFYQGVINSPIKFFNDNSSGRILNRYSTDLGSAEEVIPLFLLELLIKIFLVIGISIIISILNFWMVIPSIFLYILLFTYIYLHQPANKNMRRTEGIVTSPVISHMASTLQGLTTIHALKAHKVLLQEFNSKLDVQTSACYTSKAIYCTLAFWADLTCTIYTGVAIFSFFLFTGNYMGVIGLAFTTSIMFGETIQMVMKDCSEIDSTMTSIERVMDYSRLPPEPDEGTLIPDNSWPDKGNIVFDCVSMQYSTNFLALNQTCFSIKSGEKIGIVGRTGAGKSSLISALFRLFHFEGTITIDGIDTKKVPLHILRSKISIIPQEPVIFIGSLRKNLDPFAEFSDAELWNALEEVELKKHFLETGLDSPVSEGGSNFSVGERQLLCLVRTILRKAKIIVLDEATSNVDSKTDEMIQSTIRRKFEGCTVLTIAHRLKSVLDSDKILVMEAGSVVEFGRPEDLLRDTEGYFNKLVQKSNIKNI
ncbi:probable multidrug resistance-associated protein lethal(2)03659 isoform X2 [Tribolium madens]|nr:probable multidrug resistance-associated protein lethal(2)03659 isoform X2 [Tribolium madens]